MEAEPFPHNCNRVLDFMVIGADRILLTCAICHKTVAVIENFKSFKVEVNVQIKADKIYPRDKEAEYSEQTIKELV